MKTVFFTTMICLTAYFASAQTTRHTGFDNVPDQQEWTMYRLGDQGHYEWNFPTSNSYSAPASLAHNYPVGGSQVTDDWMVSSEFDFSQGGSIDSLRYAFSGFSTPQAGDTIAIYLLTGSADPASATTQTILYSFSDSTYQNDNTWRKIENVPIPNTAGKSYIAFRYVTVANWLDVRFDNLSITENITSSLARIAQEDIQIFPNPAGNVINLQIPAGTAVERAELVDIQGRIVKTFKGNTRSFDVSEVSRGNYLLKLNTNTGVMTRSVILK